MWFCAGDRREICFDRPRVPATPKTKKTSDKSRANDKEKEQDVLGVSHLACFMQWCQFSVKKTPPTIPVELTINYKWLRLPFSFFHALLPGAWDATWPVACSLPALSDVRSTQKPYYETIVRFVRCLLPHKLLLLGCMWNFILKFLVLKP